VARQQFLEHLDEVFWDNKRRVFLSKRRLITVALSIVLLISVGGSDAGGATIMITATVSDRGFDTVLPRGVYEGVYGNPSVTLVDEDPIGTMPFHNERTAVEFPLGAIAAGSVIDSVSVRLSDIFNGAGGGQVEVHGYVGDGSIQVMDLNVFNLVGSLVLPAPDPVTVALSASWLQTLVDSSDPFAGLTFQGTPGATLVLFSFAGTFGGIPVALRPTLIVEVQDQVIPEPGTITLVATGMVLAARRLRRKAIGVLHGEPGVLHGEPLVITSSEVTRWPIQKPWRGRESTLAHDRRIRVESGFTDAARHE
jgi:hypothetical protein